MAHIHIIEDEKGDMVDRKVYCSDSCNTYDNQDNYQGWNGCHEISFRILIIIFSTQFK